MVEKAQFMCVNEQFETIFNAELAKKCVLGQPFRTLLHFNLYNFKENY